ncbi:hypothetical protein [Halorhabdus rudnickae]|nr:hypothetical protein [Halorhabdus rudnickae]
MSQHNHATVVVELADVPGDREGIAEQVEDTLEDKGMNVENAHTKYLKEL